MNTPPGTVRLPAPTTAFPAGATSASSVPVEAVRLRRAGGGGGARWLVALAATVLVIAGAVGLAAAAGAGNTSSSTLAYAPANVVAYAEMRLDLPGDQRDQATRLLARFPGFLDGASLNLKIERMLDGALGNATEGRFRYASDVATWFAGPVAVAILPADASRGPNSKPRPVVLASVKDREQAEALLQRVRSEAAARGTSVTSTVVAGYPGWRLEPARADAGVTAVLTDDVLLLAEQPSDLEPILDAKAGRSPSLARSESYLTASLAAPSDRIGTLYMSGHALGALLGGSPVQGELPAGISALMDGLPDWAFAILRVESDRVVLDARAAASSGPPTPVRPSTIVDGVAASAVVYVEQREAGRIIGEMVAGLRDEPGAAEQMKQLGQLEPLLGVELESFFGFVGDVGLVVLPPAEADGLPQVGLVASVTDELTAAARLTRLRALLALGGDRLPVNVTTEQRELATIVTVMPKDPGIAGTSALSFNSISWALDRERLVVGLTPAFVKTILDVPAGRGLGDDPAFREAAAGVGGQANAGLAYVDVQGLLELAGPWLVSGAGSDLGVSIAAVGPYLEQLGTVVAARGRDGETTTARMILAIRPSSRQPSPTGSPVTQQP